MGCHLCKVSKTQELKPLIQGPKKTRKHFDPEKFNRAQIDWLKLNAKFEQLNRISPQIKATKEYSLYLLNLNKELQQFCKTYSI
jgi:hypothetical protein